MSYEFPHEHGIIVPKIYIEIQGKELTKDQYEYIREVKFESNATGSDVARVNIFDPHKLLVDRPYLNRGAEIIIEGGWKGDMTTWLNPGFISMVDIDYNDNGQVELTIRAMDESFILDRYKHKDTFEEATFDEIASDIAYRNGLTANGPPTEKVHEHVAQSHETDIDFLLRLAEEEEMVIQVAGEEIRWWPKYETLREEKPQDTFVWRDTPFNLISFRPRINTSDIDEEEMEHDIDVTTKETEEAHVTHEPVSEPLGKQMWLTEEGPMYISSLEAPQLYEPPFEPLEEELELELDEEFEPPEEELDDYEDEDEPEIRQVEPRSTRQFDLTDLVKGLYGAHREVEFVPKEPEEVTTAPPVEGEPLQEELERERRKKEFILDGRARTQPNPHLIGGWPVVFKNLGERFSGRYGVETVRNVITRTGYTQQLEVTRNATYAIIEDIYEPRTPAEDEDLPRQPKAVKDIDSEEDTIDVEEAPPLEEVEAP